MIRQRFGHECCATRKHSSFNFFLLLHDLQKGVNGQKEARLSSAGNASDMRDPCDRGGCCSWNGFFSDAVWTVSPAGPGCAKRFQVSRFCETQRGGRIAPSTALITFTFLSEQLWVPPEVVSVRTRCPTVALVSADETGVFSSFWL